MIRQKNNELFGKSIPPKTSKIIFGGVVSFLFFIVVTIAVFFNASPIFYSDLYILKQIVIILLSPGMLTLIMLDQIGISEIISPVGMSIILMPVTFGISSIPFTIFGALLGSENKKGIVIIFFILYIILLIIGLPIWGFEWTSLTI